MESRFMNGFDSSPFQAGFGNFLAFYGTSRQPFYEIALQSKEQEHDGRRGNDGTRSEIAPFRIVVPNIRVEQNWKGVRAFLIDKGLRKDKLVPSGHEGEKSGYGQCRFG